jgi:hypothetical protein
MGRHVGSSVRQEAAKRVSWVPLICMLLRDWQRKDTGQGFAKILSALGAAKTREQD